MILIQWKGALINDGTPNEEKPDDKLEPGQSYTYTWECRADFGPLPDDESCITVPYYSHFKEPKDIHSGLVGMAVVCRPGKAHASMKYKRCICLSNFIFWQGPSSALEFKGAYNLKYEGNHTLSKRQFVD